MDRDLAIEKIYGSLDVVERTWSVASQEDKAKVVSTYIVVLRLLKKDPFSAIGVQRKVESFILNHINEVAYDILLLSMDQIDGFLEQVDR